jgi:putative hydrolase of the HAD superfamily
VGNEMKYKAVIFDLFGTLVDNFAGRRYEQLYRQMAELLGVDGETFWRTWVSEPFVRRRASGQYERFEEYVQDVCAAMRVTYDPAAIPEVIELRMQVVRDNMKPRPDTVSTLEAIRGLGLKVGLVSDCSCEVPVVWPETPMAGLVDEAIFSCTAKIKKPDPRLYEMICERLAVRPQECLYVGDCGSDELAGARQAGMDAALICVPYEEETVLRRPEAQRWGGPRVSSVAEVMGLVSAE